MAQITASPTQASHAFVAPYEPSWINRVMNRVDRLPIPYWLFYVVLGAVLITIMVAIQWAGGATQIFHPIWVIVGLTFAYMLGGIHYLDHLASDMLEKSRPTLRVSDDEYAQLRFRLTTLPTRRTWIITGVGFLFGMVFLFTLPFSEQQQAFQVVDSPLSVLSIRIFNLLNLIVGPLVWYHTQHQLQTVSEIFEHHTNVDLFNLKPIYAFSVLSARTAFAYVLYSYALLAASPLFLQLDFTRAVLVVLVVMIAFVFVWPLLGVHRRLVDEKEQILAENSRRMQRLTGELNTRIDGGQYENIGMLNTALASLELERTRISRISTWPWRPETVRGLAASVILPLLIWGLQVFVEKLLK